MMPSNYLIFSHPLLLPSIFPSLKVFSSELVLHIRWPSIGISASVSVNINEYSGLISFKIDWFNLFAVQGTLESLLQPWFFQDSSRNSVHFEQPQGKHQFFRTQPSLWSNSHICTTTEKTIALTIQTFVGKVMSLILNMLSRLVIAFLPRSKYLLISWLQSLSAMILELKKIKSVTVSMLGFFVCFFPHLFAIKWWDRTSFHFTPSLHGNQYSWSHCYLRAGKSVIQLKFCCKFI